MKSETKTQTAPAVIKKLLSIMLACVMLFSIASAIPTTTEAATAWWSSNYKQWSQNQTAYRDNDDWMRKYGCRFVADCKLIYETGINRSSSFNPDIYYKKYYKSWDSWTNVVAYAKSLGNNNLSFKGATTNSADANKKKVLSNVNSGYYSILDLGNHFVLVDNATTKSKGSIYYYDSYGYYTNSSGNYVCATGTPAATNALKQNIVKVLTYVYSGSTPAPTTNVTVKFYGNGGTVSASSLSVKKDSTMGKNIPTATKSGYLFDGWYTAASGGTRYTNSTKITSNTNLYAHWSKINNYTGGLETGVYRIISKKSGMALEADGTADGSLVKQKPISNSKFQLWAVGYGGGVTFSNLSCGKLLDVKGGSTNMANEAQLQLYGYDNGSNSNRTFIPVYQGSGYYSIHALHSNRVLDIAKGSTSSGAQCQQYYYTGAPQQLFYFEKVYLPIDSPVANLTVNSDGTFKISWNSVSKAGGYEVYMFDRDTQTYKLKRSHIGTSITTEQMPYGTVEKFYVKAISSSSNWLDSSASNIVSGINNTKLQTPSTKITTNADGSFKITWSKITGADKYEVYCDNGNGYKLLKTVTGLSLTNNNTIYGKKYSFKVRAVNNSKGSATSAFSNVVSATNTKKLQAPTAKITTNSNGNFTVTWNKITGADKYEVYCDSGNGYKFLKTVTELSLTKSNTIYGKKYSFKIKAIKNNNSTVTSAFSNAVTATNTKKLQTPTAKITTNSNGSFTVTWNKITGADKYEIYCDTGNGYKILKTVTGLSLTKSNTIYGKKYSFKVKAIKNNNSAVTSAFSNAVTATNTKKLQTPTAKITANSNGGFKLTWNKITGADKYQIYYDNGTGYKAFKTVTGTSLTIGTTIYGKKYQFKVRAVKNNKSAVTSAFSNVVTATNTKKLQTPNGAKVSVNKNGNFTISWNKVTGADKYQVYIYDSKTKKYKLYKTTTANKVTTGVAVKGRTYSYKVRAITNKNNSATSAFSSVVSAKRK